MCVVHIQPGAVHVHQRLRSIPTRSRENCFRLTELDQSLGGLGCALNTESRDCPRANGNVVVGERFVQQVHGEGLVAMMKQCVESCSSDVRVCVLEQPGNCSRVRLTRPEALERLNCDGASIVQGRQPGNWESAARESSSGRGGCQLWGLPESNPRGDQRLGCLGVGGSWRLGTLAQRPGPFLGWGSCRLGPFRSGAPSAWSDKR